MQIDSTHYFSGCLGKRRRKASESRAETKRTSDSLDARDYVLRTYVNDLVRPQRTELLEAVLVADLSRRRRCCASARTCACRLEPSLERRSRRAELKHRAALPVQRNHSIVSVHSGAVVLAQASHFVWVCRWKRHS